MALNKNKVKDSIFGNVKTEEINSYTEDDQIKIAPFEKINIEVVNTGDTHQEIISDSILILETEIFNLKKDIAKSIWLIGQRLFKINEKKLYKDRFKTFYEYCEKNLDITRRTVYNMMFVFQNFSFVQSIAHGSKLYLLQPVNNKIERDKLIEWIEKENPSRRQIEQKIKFLNIKPEEHKQKKFFIKTIRNDKNIISKTIINYEIIKEDKREEFYTKLENLIKEYSIEI